MYIRKHITSGSWYDVPHVLHMPYYYLKYPNTISIDFGFRIVKLI